MAKLPKTTTKAVGEREKCPRCGAGVLVNHYLRPEDKSDRKPYPHECEMFPPATMAVVYGPLWMSKFPEYEYSGRKWTERDEASRLRGKGEGDGKDGD